LVPDFDGRVQFACCDLLAMPFREQFDGTFSTASFHWVRDHEALFRGLYGALKPDGWLCAQCGGGKNLDRLLARVHALMATEPYARYFAGYQSPWEYADAETTSERLRRAGFDRIQSSLEEAPTKFPNAQEFQRFVESVILRNHLECLPDPSLRQSFLAHLTALAAADDPPFLLDYWRLNLEGRRPSH